MCKTLLWYASAWVATRMIRYKILILCLKYEDTALDVRQKYHCQKCAAKGNACQILSRGNSEIALDGSGVKQT